MKVKRLVEKEMESSKGLLEQSKKISVSKKKKGKGTKGEK